ncbi:hypothetical protein OF364_00095 [Mycoplasma enhydrae]|uniref:hypothetical protein n=1 Tax=Mycoplasma enhydrae TaxID=2499220 RepID=UPI00197CA000|nr:hypothetical protein [Mycoplasma enhydrae]MBN4089546.1 hypothetical protein [Mycoplasma enhydrae]MCV3733523.1 hypothetical protein [Mycoplasma enhydrae]MCV3753229.1 hypothetical protein [Mycoplasma enhydrae]
MKKRNKLLMLMPLSLLVAPMMVSCIKTENLKYSLYNHFKTKILDNINDVNKYFPNTNDLDIIVLKNDLNKLIIDLKAKRITEQETFEKLKQETEQKLTEIMKRFTDSKTQKIEAIEAYANKAKDFQKWILKNIARNTKYVSIVDKIETYFNNEQELKFNMSLEEINQKTQSLENLIIETKLKKIEIDSKTP